MRKTLQSVFKVMCQRNVLLQGLLTALIFGFVALPAVNIYSSHRFLSMIGICFSFVACIVVGLITADKKQ